MKEQFQQVLAFVEVSKKPEQIKSLYELLARRTHNISHKEMPTFEQHCDFVKSDPYRVWFLIYLNEYLIGSFYIKNDNSVGLDLQNPNKMSVASIIKFIKDNFKPNEDRKSLVPPYFYINVPSTHDKLKNAIECECSSHIQLSYKI